MSSRIGNFFRSYDSTGVPISLNLNGESSHKTITGGLCSFCVTIVSLVIFFAQMQQVFFDLNFSKSESIEYLTFSDGHEPFQISTDDVIPALQMVNDL